MAYKILKFFISISLFLSNVSFGQNDNILFLMDNVPSSKNVNIASFDDSIKFNFSVPLLSSIQTSLNSDFVYDNIIKRKIDNSKFIDTNSFFNSLTNKNEISFYSKLNLLRLGFKVKNDYIDISIDEKINFDLSTDKGLFEFLIFGNKEYENNDKIGEFSSDFLHHREFSVAFIKKLNIKNNFLFVGVKPKYYFGLADVNINGELNYKNEDDFSSVGIHLNGNGSVSAPVEINSNELDFNNIKSTFAFQEYILNTDNYGYGIDLGLNYRTPKLKIDFSVIDIGKINWKLNTKNIEYDLSYNFEGLDISNSIDSIDENYIGFNDLINNTLDSLETSNYLKTSNYNYSKNLKTKFFLNSSYVISDKFSLGILLNSSTNDLFKDLNVSIHSSFSYNDIFKFLLSYNSTNKLGLGISIKGGPLQFYFLSDNIFKTLKIFRLNELRSANLNFGINFIF